MQVLLLVLGLAFATQVYGAYDQCGAARALYNVCGFPRAQINDWVCLTLHESSWNTAAVGGPNSDGSHDYGLFQINDNYWCGKNGPGGDCNIACSALTNSDISDDCACAKLIYSRQGFNAWYGWINHCENQALTDVSYCL